MKRKINKQLAGIAFVAIAATMLLMTAVFYELFKHQVHDDLCMNANILRDTGVFSPSAERMPELEMDNLRVTWIGSDGTVLYDNDADVGDMENHLERPEVIEAIETGDGQAVRRSDTLNQSTYYYALRLEDGSVLRVAREADNILSVFETALPSILGIILLMVVLCVLLAKWFTARLIEPIEKMAVDIEGGSLKPAYKELVPFANMIRAQHEDILKGAKMRQDFTANVSHELKTPLTAISGYAELMENGIVQGEEVKRFSAEIRKNANRLLSLINDIIKLSELDHVDAQEQFEPLDLYEIASACVENLRINAARHMVSLTLDGSPARVRGNREMLTELIINLCDNAIRYNVTDGWVAVTVKQQENKTILSVEDNGIGIPKEHQDRVFERFYRVDKSRSKKTGGTGLGLALVKHIVALHDASLELESEPGKGTKISVTF